MSVHPIETLREQSTALEAALLLCLARPKPKEVHRLRTGIRRIEAQLELLRLAGLLTQVAEEADRVLRQLKKVRRAAGAVRDHDVQKSMLKSLSGGESDEAVAGAGKLRKQIGKERRKGADRLTELLKARRNKLAFALEALLDALENGPSPQLSAAKLLRLTEENFRSLPELREADPTDDQLHAIRKVAKRARYITEGAPDFAAAARAAQGFEAFQKLAGEWHDWLVLAEIAVAGLGTDQAFSTYACDQRDRHLYAVREQLKSIQKAAR